MRTFLLASFLLIGSSASAQQTDYPENSVIVVATPGYLWAAKDISMVLGVRGVPMEVSLVEAADIAKQQENVRGVVEVEISVAQFYETVYAICRNDDGKEIWRVKRMLNFGGGPDRLARDMVRGLLKKVKGKKCPA